MNRFFQRVQTPFVCLVTCLVCIFLHEAGHAAAAYLSGGRVKSFVIFSARPHVRVEGSSSNPERAFTSAAGSVLFLAAWFLFVLFTPTGKYVAAVETSSFFAFIEGLAWVLSSLIYPHGSRSYDVWKFIRYSGVDPLFVVWISLCLAAAATAAILYRRTHARLIPS